jgi:putative tricarboxylic transport membrane protein
MRFHDTLLGLILMALAAAFFSYTKTFPEFPGQRYGPSLFPQLIAAGVFCCGLVMAFSGRRSQAPWLALSAALRGRRLVAFFAIPLGVVFYLLVAEPLGFLPTAALLVAALAWWLGARALSAVVLGVLSAGAIQWFFGALMRVPLPRGWFMNMISGA